MRKIEAKVIHEKIRDMILDANRNLPKDVYQAFEKCKAAESSESGKEVLRQLLENADYAAESKLALCQDTGAAIFFVEHGEDVRIEGGTLNEVLNTAMVEAYRDVVAAGVAQVGALRTAHRGVT